MITVDNYERTAGTGFLYLLEPYLSLSLFQITLTVDLANFTDRETSPIEHPDLMDKTMVLFLSLFGRLIKFIFKTVDNCITIMTNEVPKSSITFALFYESLNVFFAFWAPD
jgi:hypothetical protein